MKPQKSKKVIYLDNAATTPLAPEVLLVMQPFFTKEYGNPSSLYSLGVHASTALEVARKEVADVLKCRAKEIVFTAGATESINLAVLGYCRSVRTSAFTPHVITTAIEHEAVLECCKQLETEGFSVTYLPVSKDGLVDPKEFKKALRPETVFASIMYANNEVGSIQPIFQISRILRHANQDRRQAGKHEVVLHSDAAQAAGYLDINVQKLSVDMLSINGSKVYGPKQTGCLFVREGIGLQPIIFGGGQERGLRSGTQNVAGFVGFARALKVAENAKQKELKRVTALRDWFVAQLEKKFGATLNGPDDRKLHLQEARRRMPNNLHMSFPGVEGEALMLYLDAWNIAVSTGSACAEAGDKPSHVLTAIGNAEPESAIRYTLGRYTLKTDLLYVLKVLDHILPLLRNMKKLE
ncbi:MAG TPA: cysteine desulfurase family protein [Patescibacteria group bacterium]|nr:cysteine desulfurase family protein [Patescibacteria group bacterium]